MMAHAQARYTVECVLLPYMLDSCNAGIGTVYILTLSS